MKTKQTPDIPGFISKNITMYHLWTLVWPVLRRKEKWRLCFTEKADYEKQSCSNVLIYTDWDTNSGS